MIWLIGIGLIVLGLFVYFKFFKLYKIKSIVFVDGGLGAGKSFYSVALAIRLYKRSLRRYKIKRLLLKAVSPFSKACALSLARLEEPLLYSNILLRNIPFVKLTKDLILRKNFRFAYRSVLLIDEMSLLADQYLFKDRITSERMTLFFKLLRHELKGGVAVINSQSVSDLPYSLKYVLSDYLYIHHRTSLPFISVLKVQEMAYCGDKDGGQIVNARNEDLEETCKNLLVFNRYKKYYDTYCYSVFTDGLPIYRKLGKRGRRDSLKDTELVSFKEYQFLRENLERLEKEKHENVN